MICTVCGKEFPDGSSFCTNCGAPISAMSAAAPAAEEFKTVAPAGYQDAIAPEPVPVATDEFKTVAPAAYQDAVPAPAPAPVPAPAPAPEPIQPTVGVAPAAPAPDVIQPTVGVAPAPAPEPIQPTVGVTATQDFAGTTSAAAPFVAQPAPAPAPAAAPAKKKGGNAKFIVPIIILVVLLFFTFIGMVVGLALFAGKNKALNEANAQIAELEAENGDITAQVSTKDSKINSLTNDLNNTKSELETAKAEIETAKEEAEAKAEEYRLQAESYKKGLDKLQKDLGAKVGNDTFYASNYVVFVKKGQKVNIPITLNKSGQFKFTYRPDNALVTPEWKNDWSNGGKTCSIDLIGGKTAGRTILTFTNTLTSDSFSVAVIVID